MAKREKTRYAITFNNIHGAGEFQHLYKSYADAEREMNYQIFKDSRDVASGYVDLKAVYSIEKRIIY